MDEEPASNAGYIVIVVIIIVLILVALVVFGLHYKRKLPESFYNLGGLIKGDKQWKPVLSKVKYHSFSCSKTRFIFLSRYTYF